MLGELALISAAKTLRWTNATRRYAVDFAGRVALVGLLDTPTKRNGARLILEGGKGSFVGRRWGPSGVEGVEEHPR